MSKHDEPFRPEQVDEQIEALVYVEERSALSNACLISQLHQVYDEESEIVAQVWERLSSQATQQRKSSAGQGNMQSTSYRVLRTEQSKGPQLMETSIPKKQKHNRRLRFFEMFAAVLIVAALVGGMVLALKVRQPSLTASKSTATPTATKTATPTPGPVASSQVGLYAVTQQEIEQVDLQSGKTTGHFKSGFSFVPVIANGVIYFNDVTPATGTITNSSVFHLNAVNVITGKQLWRKEYGWGTLLASNGILYDGSCSSITSTNCSITGINPNNGAQLWSYATTQGSSWINAQNGIVYGVSYSQFFALNGTTGAPLWQKTLPNNAQAFMTPLVNNGALYFLVCSGNTAQPNSSSPTKPLSGSPMQPLSGFTDCSFSAFNATNGGELWHKSINPAIGVTTPAEANGVVYITTSDGTLIAVNAKNGSTIWTYQMNGSTFEPVLISNGIIYIDVISSTQQNERLLALDATTRTLKWSKDQTFQNEGAALTSTTTQPLDFETGGASSFTHPLASNAPEQPLSGGGSGPITPTTFALDTDKGLIYAIMSDHTVSVFHADTGELVKSYTIAPASISAFVLVTHNT